MHVGLKVSILESNNVLSVGLLAHFSFKGFDVAGFAMSAYLDDCPFPSTERFYWQSARLNEHICSFGLEPRDSALALENRHRRILKAL